MRWHKFISVILHPIVMPTIGVLLYFIITPNSANKIQQYTILTIVFIATYILSLLLLVFLKSVGYIKSFQVASIKERKIPLFFMITLFYVLGKNFFSASITRDISYLFYGTSLALIFVYCIFFLKIKTSLHVLSMGSAVGYFLILQYLYSVNTLPIVMLFVLLAGIMASSRLHLKAHTPKEVYLGFFVGFISQFIVYYIL